MHGPSPYNFVDLTTEPPTSPASHESGIVQAVGQSLAVLEGIQTRRGIRKEALRKKIRNASNRRRILVEHYKEMLAQQDNIKAELEEFRTFFENHEARLESGLTSRQNSAVMAIISSVEPVSDQKLRVLETLREDELRNDEEERLSPWRVFKSDSNVDADYGTLHMILDSNWVTTEKGPAFIEEGAVLFESAGEVSRHYALTASSSTI
ncbi:hypothetical protein C1H76_7544 [Elsinoe australis]|uniref:Uncharacterized protein n=1 Tax=Elsinoe australis TaxID=40998 RepID=A0A4U7AUJ9_9PEZI|nr:hypothetical protein C1H76_7544 [Elsinoe australis]